jgi:hypothetical protein
MIITSLGLAIDTKICWEEVYFELVSPPIYITIMWQMANLELGFGVD